MRRAKDLRVLLVLAVLGTACAGLDLFAPRRGHSSDEDSVTTAQTGWGSVRWPWERGRRDRPRDDYPLDEHARRVPTEGRLECPDVDLVRYRGEVVRYDRSLRVAEPFREKLQAFEETVRDVAIRHYGRAPRRIRTFGAFNCRRVRGRPYRMSEHSLGNGIDVEGFNFGPAPREVREARDDLPRRLHRPFSVTVLRHWEPRRERDEAHSAFLRDLTAELARRDVFRAMIGPRHRRHRNHFHFDYGPFRYRIL